MLCLYDYINLYDSREYLKNIEKKSINLWSFETLINDLKKNVIITDYLNDFIKNVKFNINQMNKFEERGNMIDVAKYHIKNEELWNKICNYGITDSLNDNNNFNKYVDKIKSSVLIINKIILKDNIKMYLKIINKNVIDIITYLTLFNNYYSVYKNINKYNNILNDLKNIKNIDIQGSKLKSIIDKIKIYKKYKIIIEEEEDEYYHNKLDTSYSNDLIINERKILPFEIKIIDNINKSYSNDLIIKYKIYTKYNINKICLSKFITVGNLFLGESIIKQFKYKINKVKEYFLNDIITEYMFLVVCNTRLKHF